MANFKTLLKISNELHNIPLSHLTCEQIEELYADTYQLFIENLEASISDRITTSIYFPHYKYLINSPQPDNPFLRDPIPWTIKKFIVQLRINPNYFEMHSDITLLSPNQPCPICNQASATWHHLLVCNRIITCIKPPLNFQIPLTSKDFYSYTIPNLTLPIALYLFKIVKLISQNNSSGASSDPAL